MSARSTLLALSSGMFSVSVLVGFPPQLLPVYGGSGGTAFTRSCGARYVVTSAEIKYGTYVNHVRFRCRPWNAAARTFGGTEEFPNNQVGENNTGSIVAGQANSNTEKCEASSQTARRIRGRASSLVDAIGFICNEP